MVGVSYLMVIFYYLSGVVNCIADCPKNCYCLGEYVLCNKLNLVNLTNNIPKWTERLNLNNNNIKLLEGYTWNNLMNLTELKLNKNKISHITKDTFNNKKKLKTLELNRNQLQDIEPLSFKSLEQLTTLKLKRNRIRQLRDGAFFGLKKIQTLELDYNLIQVISKGWLYELVKLKDLSISNNLIHQIEPDAWEFCTGLNTLDLSYNRLDAIKKDTFKHLSLLQKLILNSNNISIIEDDAFAHIANLQVMQLNDNKVSWTIEDGNGVFRNLINLQKFYLVSNNIKSINTNAFDGLVSIKYLDLISNNVTSVQKNAFDEMPLLTNLKLNTTALLCDCNLRWLFDYLRDKSFKVRAVCAYPTWLRNLPLLEIPANNLTCDDSPKPRLIQEPEAEIMALKGGDISLSCTAISSSSTPMNFLWKKDNVELINGQIFNVKPTTHNGKNTEIESHLNIFKIQHSDAGKYQCVVSNSFGTTYSQKTSILVLIYPTFKKMPTNITVRAGTTARLECAAEGEPQPEIAWQKDGGNDFPAARERRMHVMPTDDVFFIINAKPSDMGVYSCTAHNIAGTIVANATLTIEEKPLFVRPMLDKEVSTGESAVLQCMAGGAPKPTIQWLKDGSPIHATERHFFTAEDQLMIIVDTNINDAGTYICKLNNSLGEVTAFSKLRVKQTATMGSDTMGIIIITVVCCAVATSVFWVVIIYQTRRRMSLPNTKIVQPEATIIDYADQTINHFADNTSEHSSCKDSGTGDSAKRSNDDLLPGDEITLIINGLNPEDKETSMRQASLVYLLPDGNNLHTPLLHTDNPYPRSTNHDRLSDDVADPEEVISDSPTDLNG